MADDLKNNNQTPDNPESSPFVTGEGFSLESILAEVKGSAFIDGENKIPSHILEAEAERILRETTPELAYVPDKEPLSDTFFESEQRSAAEPFAEPYEEPLTEPFAEPVAESFAKPFEEPFQDNIPVQETSQRALFSEPESPEDVADRLITEAYERFDEPDIFKRYSEPEFDDTEEIPLIVTPSEDGQTANVDASATKPIFIEDITEIKEHPTADIPLGDSGTDERKAERMILFNQTILPEDEEFGAQTEDDEEIFQEPRLKTQAIKFARTCNSISQRLLPATIITIIMVLITYVYEAGMMVPFGIGRNLDYAAGSLVVFLLIVMMLCIEVIIRGVDCLIIGEPNAETLVLFSCVFSLVSATFTMLSGTALMLPFCAVSALSLVFAAFGERSNLRAMTDSLKTAISSAEPYGIKAEYNENIDNSVLKKVYGRTDGFYTNLISLDITEMIFKYAAPVLLIAALFSTVINVLVNNNIEHSLHILSALLASTAPFSLLISYPIPFSIVTKSIKKLGVALAGWGGADEIAHIDGVCVTDDDFFPEGTLRLSSVKVFDGASTSNVLCYTASLIIASGSGLTGLFAEAVREQGITPLRVAHFECHESGISALVQGHQVATGSAAHMNLIGVRVPDDSNLRNAVFTAVNGRLVAMFAIDYKPLPSVQKALISLLKWRIDLFFAMRDFNITPSMVGQKFKVPFESFVFMPVKETYSISDPYSGKQGRMAAVLVRESLGPYAEAITCARLLRSASLFATILSAASAGLGLLIMFIMLWDGSFLSATPGNLIVYMMCMLGAVLIICAYVRIRK